MHLRRSVKCKYKAVDVRKTFSPVEIRTWAYVYNEEITTNIHENRNDKYKEKNAYEKK